MELTIHVDLHCAHTLKEIFPEGHPCGRLHGHTYCVTVGIECRVLPEGVVVDFGEIKNLLKKRYDHGYLNDIMESVPTAENLAVDIFLECLHHIKGGDAKVSYVEVGETKNNIVRYTVDAVQ